jgi:quercetin dioxygenase-like cupin family protein
MLPARLWIYVVLALLLALGILLSGGKPAATREASSVLLDTGTTTLGQKLSYPAGAAHVTAVVVTMQPGETTGWHRHDVPMFGYMLDGEITVDYGKSGTRTYRQGDAVMEAVDVLHDGRNTGRTPARVLAVFLGADGVPNTVMAGAPPK